MSKNNYWHYQIINKGTKDDPLLCVHEVYFDGQTNKIVGWGQDAVKLEYLERTEDIKCRLNKILEDIEKYDVLLEPELPDNDTIL
jgi:hypothetical protein